jgi:uncharacterized protein YjiS (DUF1127 family)
VNIFTAFFDRAAKRRTYSSMLQLDDHLLRDIGLTRSDLHEMMAGTRTAHSSKSTRTNA